MRNAGENKSKSPNTKRVTSTHAPAAAPADRNLPAAQYDAHLPAALALPESEVLQLRGDTDVAIANIRIAVASLEPEVERIREKLAWLPTRRLLEAEGLALAVSFAVRRVHGEASERSDELRTKLAELTKLREPVLLDAEVKALMGVFPEQRVARIREGTGMLDMAKDGVDLEALYREHAQVIVGQNPFTREHLQRLAELGSWLQLHVTATGARRLEDKEQRTEAQNLRDRLWTLLVRTHAEMRAAGFIVFGEARLDEKVPPLLSRSRGVRAEVTVEADVEADETLEADDVADEPDTDA